MSDLIIATFASQTEAYVAGDALVALQQEAGTEPEDIVVVTRDGTGRVSVNQSIDLATGRPLGGGGWGALIAMLFLDPRKPVASGNGLAAQFRATGLDDGFLSDVVHALDKGGAAVGLRVRLLGSDRVRERLKQLKSKPRILRTRLSPDTEEALYDMQTQIPQDGLI